MKIKKIKSLVKTAGSIAYRANAAYKVAGRDKVNVMRIDDLKKSALKDALGEKKYKQMIQGTKKLVGEKTYRRLDRAEQVSLQLDDAAYQGSRGNFKGSKDALGRAITKGVGKKALREGQHAGQDLIGKKNYNAIHHIGNRTLNVGLSVASAYAAAKKGNPKGALNYGLNAVRTGVGAKAIHKVKGQIRDKIGQKNYDLLNNSYKAMQMGMDIGKTMSQINEGYDLGKSQKMVNKTIKLANQTRKAAKLIKTAHKQAGAHPDTGSIIAQAGPEPRPMTVTTSNVSNKNVSAPIGGGGGGKRPRIN
jgi:hypothetical protein